jgi:hypothetical protein
MAPVVRDCQGRQEKFLKQNIIALICQWKVFRRDPYQQNPQNYHLKRILNPPQSPYQNEKHQGKLHSGHSPL